jgi:hypothetical protein
VSAAPVIDLTRFAGLLDLAATELGARLELRRILGGCQSLRWSDHGRHWADSACGGRWHLRSVDCAQYTCGHPGCTSTVALPVCDAAIPAGEERWHWSGDARCVAHLPWFR